MKTRIIVFGSTGMLGGAVSRVLSREPAFEVLGTHRGAASSPLFFDGLGPDRTLGRLLAGASFAINCIGLTKPEIREGDPASLLKAERINSELPHRLAEAGLKAGARLIHISTDGVFSGRAGPYDEASRPDPVDAYGRTKLAGEIQGPNALTLRCSIIGPDSARKRGLFEWFRSLKPGDSATGYTNHLWNGVTTFQFARLCRLIVSGGHFDSLVSVSSLRHLCPNETVTKHQLLESFNARLAGRVTILPRAAEPVCDRTLRSRWSDLNGLLGREQLADALDEMLAAQEISEAYPS